MKRQRDNYVRQFVDLEARVDDDEDEHDEDDDTLHNEFIEDQSVDDTHYVPFSNRDGDSNEAGWAAPVIARLQERYTHPRDRQLLVPLEDPSAAIERSAATTILPDVGTWVQVRMGIYKGDVGYVKSTETWGVHLLLVPRLPPPQPTCLSQKRKRTSAPSPTPKLFDPIDIKLVHGVEVTWHAENVYLFNGCLFEHGLIVKTYDFHSISTSAESMSISLFTQFRESRHPKLFASEFTFPRPSEWEFNEGDEVYIYCLEYFEPKKRGIITALRLDSVEVELAAGEGNVTIPWLDIRKVVSIGDYVELTGGKFRGQRGWVDNVDHEVASLVEDLDGQKPSTSDVVKRFDAHVNLLKRALVPFSHGTQSTHSNDIARSDKVPWINTQVRIAQQGNAMRTRPGIVTNVLARQKTSSGLKVEVELTTLDSVNPFRKIILDYNDVVEASLSCKLYDLARPETELFVPRNCVSQPLFCQPLQPSSLAVADVAPGYATPMPEQLLSSSPAWDPHSCSLMREVDSDVGDNLLADSSNSLVLQDKDRIQHILLDPRLLNATLKVIIHRGESNEKGVIATIVSTGGRLSIRHKLYKTSSFLDPDLVTPEIPNPTRSNGLLVVIKGDHYGKYVRRIHHRYEDDGATVILRLAVVRRDVGNLEILTGEHLELDKSHLCVCAESKEERKLGDSLVYELREEAHKTRAK